MEQTGAVEVTSPFPLEAWPRVWYWIQPFRDRVTDDFAPKTIGEFVRRHIEVAGAAQTWAVWRDGELGGMVWVDRASDYLAVAHLLFKKEFWGRGTTEVALRLVFDQVFASGVGKICSNVFADNQQVLALVKALGAKREGLLEAHTLRYGGKPTDMVAVGLLKRDFYAYCTDRSGDNGRGVAGGRAVEPAEDDDGEHTTGLHAGAATAPGCLERETDAAAQQPGESGATENGGRVPGKP